ncbi:UNVERIFIED_CONTAM: hypothetical protein EX528_19005 [Xanthomonas axonopodis]
MSLQYWNPEAGTKAQADRIEHKLDALLDALADDVEEVEEPTRTLDGELSGAERDQSMSLD